MVSNVYSFYKMDMMGVYVGDFVSYIDRHTPLLLLLIAVVISYYFICGPIYSFFIKLKITDVNDIPCGKITTLGKLVVFLQVAYLVFNFFTGSNMAGGDKGSGEWLRFIWLLIPVDYMFYIYYVMARGKRSSLCRLNLLLFILSQLSRGWLGWILVVSYIELCFYVSNNSFKIKTLLYMILMTPLVVMLPFLFYFKVALRDALLNQNFSELMFLIKSVDFSVVFSIFLESLFYRLQHLSNVVFIYEKLGDISSLIDFNKVAVFYWEGLPQQTFAKITGFYPGQDMHLFLYDYYINSSMDSETTLQTGFISWLLFGPLLSVFYVLYCLFLVFISVYLSKRIYSHHLCSLTWFFVLGYIMNGWFNAFIFYIQALIMIYMVMKVRMYPK
jgi:hypothetical protein